MSRYFKKETLTWARSPVRGGTVMEKSIVWEGALDVRSAYFRMQAGMTIPKHTHPRWVQVTVLEGEMQVENEQDGVVRISAGECYFVEPDDSHTETAVRDTLVLVTQGEDRQEFIQASR